MTMPLLAPPLAVRRAGLDDRDECARIDAFVAGHPDATPFHRTAWSRAIARGCRQRDHYLVAEGPDGTIAGVLPLTAIRSRLFGNALVSAGFAIDGGILARDIAAVTVLTDAILSLAAEIGCATLELRGGPVLDAGWTIDEHSYVGFERPLAASDEAELLAIPRKQRAEVRKALAGELAVVTGTTTADLAAHYRVYAESVRNLGTPVFPAALFRAVVAEFGGDADILTVWSQGRAVASVLSLYADGVVYPYWGGGVEAARGLRANDRMYFALMSHARARGYTRFDFGRSKVGTGPAAFKKNWGFEPRPLRYAKRALDGAAMREVNPLSPRYRLQVAAWKRLPLPVANLVGPVLARGLG